MLRTSRKTVRKWLRRARQQGQQSDGSQPLLIDLPRAPHHPRRKVYFGAIHAVLTLQKKYGYAGWFRIKGYLEQDYGIYLGPTTIKKIMALNRRLHLAPQRPVVIVEVRDPREGPKKSHRPFEHVFVDFRYLDALASFPIIFADPGLNTEMALNQILPGVALLVHVMANAQPLIVPSPAKWRQVEGKSGASSTKNQRVARIF